MSMGSLSGLESLNKNDFSSPGSHYLPMAPLEVGEAF